jgi:flagellar hook-length control protein FliK
MEASLVAASSAPIPPPAATSSQSGQTTGEASPFNAFLSAAINDQEGAQNEPEGINTETSTTPSDQQEMVMAAELAALSSQTVPILNPQQPVSGNSITTNPTNPIDTSAPLLLTSAELKQLPTMSAITEQSVIDTKAIDKNPALNALDANRQPTIESSASSINQQSTISENKNESLLSQQLQAIMTGASSQDTLTIRTPSHAQSASAEPLNTLSSPYLQSQNGTILSAATSSLSAVVDSAIAEPEGANVPENTRKNIEEQFLNAKLDILTNKDTNKSQHQETSNNQAGQQGANASLATSLANNDQAGLFTLTAAGTQATSVTPASAALAQPALPPGAPVPASEIINHLVERFSSNPRLQTSKISLNLSPAELGAIKIDIMVKGDTIKAHIGANSAQVQETIEKYMPKLRTILEQQGFTVEDFQVTLDGASSDSNDFFQQQFSSQHDTEPQTKFMSSNDSFNLALHSAEEILSAPNSGINLSI